MDFYKYDNLPKFLHKIALNWNYLSLLLIFFILFIISNPKRIIVWSIIMIIYESIILNYSYWTYRKGKIKKSFIISNNRLKFTKNNILIKEISAEEIKSVQFKFKLLGRLGCFQILINIYLKRNKNFRFYFPVKEKENEILQFCKTLRKFCLDFNINFKRYIMSDDDIRKSEIYIVVN